MPIAAHDLALLKQELENEFVPSLPPLLLQRPLEEEKKKNLSRALSAFALHHLCQIKKEVAAKAVVDDFDDGGIDAIFYQHGTVYVIQSKVKETEQFKEDEAQKFCEGLRRLLRLNFDHFNQHYLDRKTEIEDAIENCSRIQLVVVHIGSGISEHARAAIDNFISDDSHDEERLVTPFLDINFETVVQYLQGGKAYPRVDATVKLECHKSIKEPRTTYFGLVDLATMVGLHQKHKNGLYEKNIRTFLGMGLKQGVNESIQKTLKDKPDHFFYLNNGITALCQNIEPKDSRDGKKSLKITGLSVINGAQTISSCANASEKGIDIAQAKVLLTLIKADSDAEFGKAVTKARNHQNPVSLSDFVSLEEDQERLRREAAYLGIHYDYKPGVTEQSFDPTHIRVNEALPALALFHSDPRYAVWLKKEPANLYVTTSSQYKGLFTADLKIQTLINAVYFYRYVQAQIIPQIAASNGPERLTYKHGDYVLAWVLSKRLSQRVKSPDLLTEQRLKEALSQPFDEVRETLWGKVSTRLAERGPLSIFRNQMHSIPLMQEMMLQHYQLENDPVIPHKQSQSNSEDGYPKALFDYAISRAPQIQVGS